VRVIEQRILHVDIRFEPDDGIFIAEVRDLPGCVAMGRDHEDLSRNLKAAISDYMEMVEDAERVEVSDLVFEDAPVGSASEVKVLAGVGC
jgi:predicted RNase H-like HicB family nuclease